MYFAVIVELLLNQNVELNLVTEYGDTALHGAIFGNKSEIMEMLIEAGQSSLYTVYTLDPLSERHT